MGLTLRPLLNTHHADLRNTRHDESVDEVVLSAHLAEEEVDLLLVWDEAGADEGRICGKETAKYAEGQRLKDWILILRDNYRLGHNII